MLRSLIFLSGFSVMLASHASAQDMQPSFDCGQAQTTVENTICSDATLAGLDADLHASYTRAMSKAADADAFRAQQISWLGERDAACGLMPGADDEVADPTAAGIACLIDLYRSRLAQIADAGSASTYSDPARVLTGLWQIKEVIEALDPAMTDAGQKGRLIRLDRHALGALNGAGCAGPTLQPLADVRARPLDADELALIKKADAAGADAGGEGADAKGVAGFCLGRLFALYLPADDGSMLVADASALYRLQRLTSAQP